MPSLRASLPLRSSDFDNNTTREKVNIRPGRRTSERVRKSLGSWKSTLAQSKKPDNSHGKKSCSTSFEISGTSPTLINNLHKRRRLTRDLRNAHHRLEPVNLQASHSESRCSPRFLPADKYEFSDPRSLIWKGRSSNFAVVVPTRSLDVNKSISQGPHSIKYSLSSRKTIETRLQSYSERTSSDELSSSRVHSQNSML